MSTEQKIKDVVQNLVSGTGPRAMFQTYSMQGPETPDERIGALEGDVAKLYDALQVAGREIDRLRQEVRDGQRLD